MDKLKQVQSQINKILQDNNCGIIPIVQIVNNQITSRIEIIELKEKSETKQ